MSIKLPMLCLVILTAMTSNPRETAAHTDQAWDLTQWKLTLPIDRRGKSETKAQEISSADLVAGYKSPYFEATDQKLVFWCPVNGATTEGTDYPRSELREMLAAKVSESNWPAHGSHTLAARCRVSQVPSNPKVVIGQIHSDSGKARPLVKLQFFKGRMEALVKESPQQGKDMKWTFPDVGLDNEFSWRIRLKDGLLSVTVDGRTEKIDVIKNDAEWAQQTFYFKAGAYPQDNDGNSSEGARVEFSQLQIVHENK